MVSSTEGSLTSTGWNLRSSAASFSILAVLVDGSCANNMQLAAGERGFEHV